MNKQHKNPKGELTPLALKDVPALIEAVFPAQKVSFEAQRERKAGAGQTLTALGSYWKGRKPLILVRAIVLGSLLPQTQDAKKDLDIFEKLMAFDDEGLARRALIQNAMRPADIAARIELKDPWNYFTHNVKRDDSKFEGVESWTFPLSCNDKGIVIRWHRDASEDDRLGIYRKALATFSSYEERAALCKRPEEIDQEWLYAPLWTSVNRHYSKWGIDASCHQDLIEQLGILRYGHRPHVGDTFCGGGSIPFEAARLGCDVHASDLNPIACMLTWGALNIIGASPQRRAEIEHAQREVAASVNKEIAELRIEYDEQGNRAKAYLYCLETRCPETGWLVPLSPSWVISKTGNVMAKLIPDHVNKRFDIQVVSGVNKKELMAADKGTVQDGALVYDLEGKTYRTPIRTLRGDYRDAEGNICNRLRRWEKNDFKPRSEDIFQERLYAIQWIRKETLAKPRQDTFFSSITERDLDRQRKVESIVAKNLTHWQEEGLVPDMEIEPGDKTDEPIRTRGWTYWHHLFSPRHLLAMELMLANLRRSGDPVAAIELAKRLDNASKLTRMDASGGNIGREPKMTNVFSNQALNTLFSWAERSVGSLINVNAIGSRISEINSRSTVEAHSSNQVRQPCDLFVTDPPYADAVHYHEITEFFIAWLRKDPPAPFDKWIWDSRRALAIKGTGDDFRRGMVDCLPRNDRSHA